VAIALAVEAAHYTSHSQHQSHSRLCVPILHRLTKFQQAWFVPLADVYRVCKWNCNIPWEHMPYLSALKVWSRQSAIQPLPSAKSSNTPLYFGLDTICSHGFDQTWIFTIILPHPGIVLLQHIKFQHCRQCTADLSMIYQIFAHRSFIGGICRADFFMSERNYNKSWGDMGWSSALRRNMIDFWDILLYFKPDVQEGQWGSKIEAKFRTFHTCKN